MEYFNHGKSRGPESRVERFNAPKNPRLEYGYATLLVLILFAVFSSYGLEAYIMGLEESRMSRRDVNFKQTVYAAEGGIEWAKAKLDIDPEFSGGDIRIGGANVQVIVISHVEVSSEVQGHDEKEEALEAKYEVISDAVYGSDRESASARCTLRIEMEKNGEKWSILKYRESTI